MSGPKTRTNPLLILLSVLMCLIFGVVLTRSSADPTTSSETPDSIVAERADEQTSGALITGVPDPEDTPAPSEALAEPSATPEPTATPVITEFPVSPEASRGTWVSQGSQWLFMVDGIPYKSWLTDTDGKRYFFDENGIMQTGWMDDGGKRYYLDLDGIMQTGDVEYNGKTYHLLDDGSLEGFTAPTPEAEPTPEPTPVPTPTETPVPEDPDNTENDTPENSAASAEVTPAPTKQPDKTVALTFDDGPSSFTDRLLDCLEANNAKATFFMVGREISSFPDPVRRMAELGCELGSHSYTHTDLTTMSAEDISAEMWAVDDLLSELTGNGASVVRPPYGAVDDNVLSVLGTPIVLWSIDTLDWETLDAQTTVDTVMSQVQDGSIVLMHDIYETSVDAAEILIPKLIEEGYELVTVHELAEAHGKEMHTGILYGSFSD